MNFGAGEEYISCSTSGSRRVTVKPHKNHQRWKSWKLYQAILWAKYLFLHQCLTSVIFNNNLVVSSSPKTGTKYNTCVYENHTWKEYNILYHFILGCYAVDGALYYLKNISECYQKCLDKQQNAFEYFSYKVTSLELFSLFKQ